MWREVRKPPSAEGLMKPASVPGDIRAVGVSDPHTEDTGVKVPPGLSMDRGVLLGHSTLFLPHYQILLPLTFPIFVLRG